MKKIVLCIAVALIAFSAFISLSCKSEKLDIGLAMPETHVARWVTDGEKLKEYAEAKGYSAEVAYGDAKQEVQNRQIQDFITKGVSVIVVASIDTGINTVLSDAAEEGITIISYDRLLMDTSNIDYYLTFNLKKVGFLQASAIVNALDLDNVSEPQYITLFAGSPTDNNAYFFYDGAMEVLNPYIDAGKLKVVGPYPRTSDDRSTFQRIATEGWKAELAKQRMENLLTNDAKDVVLDAVLAPNDPVGRAIIEACMNDAKYDTIDKLPVVTGQDGELATVQYITEGKQNMTVFKDSRDLAKATIDLVDAVMQDKMPSIANSVKTTMSTGKKDVETYLLDPVLVTKDNVKKVIVDSAYYTKDQLQTIGY